MNPALDGADRQQRPLRAVSLGPNTNLLTAGDRDQEFSSIEPVGILKPVPRSADEQREITAMTIDSKYSRSVDFLKSVVIPVRPHLSTRETLPAGSALSRPASCASAFLLFLEQLALARDVAA